MERTPLPSPWPPNPPAPPPRPIAPPSSPAGVGFVYREAAAALAGQRQDLNALDTKAGVLIGATAAAFGLIATNGGGAQRLFARHPALETLAVFVLALALRCLVLAVLVRSNIEYPHVPTLIRLAGLEAEQIKTRSLDALGHTREHNRALILRKSRWLLAGQVVLGLFVAMVVSFKVSEWDRLAAALAWLQHAAHG